MIDAFKRRLKRLERFKAGLVRPSVRWPLMLWNMRPLSKEGIDNLSGDERVVIDWYRDIGGIVWTRERITVDPNDHGRKCERGGYLADVLQEVHRDCEYRAAGVCRACDGTAVSETPPGSTTGPPP